LPTFRYKALTLDGEQAEGTVVATTRRDAIQRLAAGGQHVVDLHTQAETSSEPAIRFRFGQRAIDLPGFSRQLATLSESGVPLVQSINVLIRQTKDTNAGRIFAEIRESVEGGSTLADALAKHPQTFPKIMVSMVRVGEIGGTLDQVLVQLSELFEREQTLRGEVRAAMAYPLLVFFLGLASAVVLVAFFIPRLENLFDVVNQALPTPTRALLALSHFVTGRGWILAALFVITIVAIRLALRRASVRVALDTFKMRVPVLGTLVRNVAIARLTRLLGTLLNGGVSVVEGLDIVEPAVGNEAIAQAVKNMAGRIRGGESLAALMQDAGLFPPLLIQMVAVGEETGRLDQVLLRVSDAYDREASTSTKVMTSLLAPVMILCVAGIVAFIILSMMLPIFQLSSVVR